MTCPECQNKMIWNNDFDMEDNEGIFTCWSCSPCHIELTKYHLFSEEEKQHAAELELA